MAQYAKWFSSMSRQKVERTAGLQEASSPTSRSRAAKKEMPFDGCMPARQDSPASSSGEDENEVWRDLRERHAYSRCKSQHHAARRKSQSGKTKPRVAWQERPFGSCMLARQDSPVNSSGEDENKVWQDLRERHAYSRCKSQHHAARRKSQSGKTKPRVARQERLFDSCMLGRPDAPTSSYGEEPAVDWLNLPERHCFVPSQEHDDALPVDQLLGGFGSSDAEDEKDEDDDVFMAWLEKRVKPLGVLSNSSNDSDSDSEGTLSSVSRSRRGITAWFPFPSSRLACRSQPAQSMHRRDSRSSSGHPKIVPASSTTRCTARLQGRSASSSSSQSSSPSAATVAAAAAVATAAAGSALSRQQLVFAPPQREAW